MAPRSRPARTALLTVLTGALAVGLSAPAAPAAPLPPLAPATVQDSGGALDLSNGGEAIVVDRTETEIAPGAVLTEFARTEPAGWQRGAVLDIDLTNPAISLDYMDSGQVAGNATISEMVEQAGAVAGVNGDFFDINNSGSALGVGVDGEEGVLTSPNPGRNNALVIDQRGVGRLTEVFLDGRAVAPDLGWEVPLTGVNASSFAGGVGVYTHRWGDYLRANGLGGREQAVEVWVGPDSRVTQTAQPVGEGEIPEDTRVVVAPAGEYADQLGELEEGDRLQTSYTVRSDADQALLAIGGGAFLVRDGVVQTHGDQSVHPRTAVGLDGDGTRLLLVVVDGRSATSRGMSLDELGTFLAQLGAHHAMNLDGGGSTQMNATTPGEEESHVVNQPSDGGERNDANGLGVVVGESSGVVEAYTVRPASRLPNADRVFPGLRRSLEALGYDEHKRAVATPAEEWVSTAPDVASVGADGVLTAVAPGRTTVNASTATSEDSVASGETDVHVLDELVRIQASSREVTLADGTSSASVVITGFDRSGYSAPIDTADVTVTAGDGFVVEPSAAATFGVTPTTDFASATATFEVAGHTAQVALIVGTETVVVADFSDAADWTFAHARAAGGIEPATGPDGQDAIRLSHDFTLSTSTRGSYAVAPEPIPVEGQPLSLTALVHSDGSGIWPRIQYTDGDGVRGNLNADTLDSEGWQEITFPVPAGTTYPITVEQIRLMETAATAQYHGEVVVAGLWANVPQEVDIPAQEVWHDPASSPLGEAEDAPLRIAVMSDAQFVARNPESAAVEAARRTIREIQQEDADLLVINGDFTDEAAPEDFDLARRILDEEIPDDDALPWIYVPGNHEIMGGPITNFVEEFGPTTTTSTWQGTRVVTLNSATGRLGSDFAQLMVLRQEIANAIADPEVTGFLVFFHHPTRDFLPGSPSQLGDRQEAAMIERWMGDLREEGVSAAVVNAGVGAFDVRTQDGVVHLTNGNAGKGPNSTRDRGGFTGWTMLGVDPAQGYWPEADGRWLDIEIRPHVDELYIVGPEALEVGATVQLQGVVEQNEGTEANPRMEETPVTWPMSYRWDAGENAVLADGRAAAAVQLAAADTPAPPESATVVELDPRTGEVTALDQAILDGELVEAEELPEDREELEPVTYTAAVELAVSADTATHEIAVEVPQYVTAEEPSEEPTKGPGDGLTEDPTGEPTDRPSEDPAGEPTEDSTGGPAAEPADGAGGAGAGGPDRSDGAGGRLSATGAPIAGAVALTVLLLAGGGLAVSRRRQVPAD